MELIAGGRNQEEISSFLDFVDTQGLEVCWPTPEQCESALKVYAETRGKSGMSVIDALIGACAAGLGMSLCTFDKDFQDYPGLSVEQPPYR